MIKKTYPKIHLDFCMQDEIDHQGNINEKPILPIFKQLYDKYFKEFFNSSYTFKSEVTEKLFHEFDILDKKALSILQNSSYSLSIHVTPAFFMQLLISEHINKYAVKVTTAIMSDAPSKYKFIENDNYKNTHEQLALLFQKAIQEYILYLVDQVIQEQKQVQENVIADEIDKTSKNAIQCVNKLVQLDEKLDSSDILADEIEKIKSRDKANRIKYKLDSVEQKLQKRHVQKQIMLHSAREKLSIDLPIDAKKVNRKVRARKLKKHIASAFDTALQNKTSINDSFISQEISKTSNAATHLALSVSMIDANMNSQDLVAGEIEKIQPYVRANRIKSKLDSAEQRLKERYTQQNEIVHEANEKLNTDLPVISKHVLMRKARMVKLKKYVVEHRDEITKKLANHVIDKRMQTIREIKQEIREVKKAVRETSALLSKLLSKLQKIKSLIQALSAKIDRVRKTINNVVSTVKNKIASFFSKKDKQESKSEITQDKQTKQNVQKRTTSIDDNSPSM